MVFWGFSNRLVLVSEVKWILCNSQVLSVTGNPCCSDPCQNKGVCTALGTDNYECDCTRTGYRGQNCTARKYEWHTWGMDLDVLVICSIVNIPSWPLQLNSSPGSKSPWSHRPTPSTTCSPTSRASGTLSTTSHFSGMLSWAMCWHVSVSSWRQNEKMDWKLLHNNIICTAGCKEAVVALY